jgi:hypothetical protein
LIDRGNCTFLLKAQMAQAAGAIAVIIVNSAPGLPPKPDGRDGSVDDDSHDRISQADGNLIKANLGGGCERQGRLARDAAHGQRCRRSAEMYAPAAFTGGSSVSHWDRRSYAEHAHGAVHQQRSPRQRRPDALPIRGHRLESRGGCDLALAVHGGRPLRRCVLSLGVRGSRGRRRDHATAGESARRAVGRDSDGSRQTRMA